MSAQDTAHVVIVGTGIAGITAAEALRANGFNGPISVIGDEPELPYRRTALSKDIVGADLSTAKITLRKPEFWTDRKIEIHTDSTVSSVDTSRRTVRLADGSEIAYTALVLATGAVTRRFDWLAPDVAVLRTRADALAVKAQLSQSKPLVVIGGGLIGLELAASAAAGTPVTVLEATDRPMARVLPPEISDLISVQHRAHGVDIHTNAVVTAATTDQVEGRGFNSPGGAFVVAALGSTPNIHLAGSAGIPLGTSGIQVDAHLRTNTPGVYAAGDVAEYPHPLTGLHHRSEHWLTAGDQGKVVAATILADLGADVEFTTTPVPLAWTVQYGINIQIAGWPGAGDRITVEGSLADLDATVRVFDGEQVIGAVSIGRPAQGRKTREEIAACLPPLQSPVAAWAAPLADSSRASAISLAG
ncbi:rubredoxin reductase [Gordonia effusa NBRC 100432]|uniref:Rubredoxin reductase n=1 Tax=Gordonia effusa NBRC 100432 TaxID=1077974 RepID=H0QVB4_9ACTN|nr:FAD-dependent oxidoreductase [Gordonia effusa]GAB16765.1 rubredoxin reductase [Gordonia effusa NBRC 100432]